MKTTENTIPSIATHPGEILLDELNAASISQVDFAGKIGYNRSQLNEIIKGKRAINAELAVLLEETLDIDAAYWLNAQSNYDIDRVRISEKAQKRLEAIKIWEFIEPNIAVKFFKKQGLIKGDPVLDIPVLKDVYGVKNIEGLAKISAEPVFARFKKSTALQLDTINLIAWVKLVHYRAKKEVVRDFNHENKAELLNKLRAILTNNVNTKERVKQTLADYGIKMIYQDKGEKTPVDGVSFWSAGKPAIGMTLRHKRLDNFSFTLFHELGHVFEHLVNSNDAEFLDIINNYEVSQEEKEANAFAQNQLIEAANWQSFYAKEDFTDTAIKAFAEANTIHPSIVLGRIRYETNNYKLSTTIENQIN